MFDSADFKEKINSFIYYLDDVAANKFFKSLKAEDLAKIQSDPNLAGEFVKLQFLLIPFLKSKEAASLLGGYLKVGLFIEDLNLAERLRTRMLFIDLGSRDQEKESLKNALFNNKEAVFRKIAIGEKNLNTVNDWLKDYIVYNGPDKDTLKEAQYFNDYLKVLKDDEKATLKALISAYNFLDASSMSPEGFEDDLLLRESDGRLVTTREGEVIVLYDPNKDEPKKGNQSNDVLAEADESGPVKIRPATAASSEAKNNQVPGNLAELEQSLKNYSPASLEYRAIQQEINRLKKLKK